jgi:transposase-like protein
MTRKIFSAEQKVAILKEHLEKQISVADICEKYRVHPNQFYKWKKELFENAVDTFSTKRGRKKKSSGPDLEAKLKDRNEVIAELLEENLKLKKFNGGL